MPATTLTWHRPDAPPFHLAGFAWYADDRQYRRLPAVTHVPLPEGVATNALCPAGGQIRAQTDAQRLSIRARLTAPADFDHMAPTGQNGFDCYLGVAGAQRFYSTTRFDRNCREYESVLLDFPTREMRYVTINFPLYRAVEEVLVGLDDGTVVLPPLPYADDRPVVVYGTSITQGGCASRPEWPIPISSAAA